MRKKRRLFLRYLLIIISAFFLAGIANILFLGFIVLPLTTAFKGETVVVNLIGLPKEEAYEILKKNKLRLGEVEEVEHADFPKGVVVAQRPKPGTKTRKGRLVNIVVSRGAGFTKVPEIYDNDLTKTIEVLQGYQLKAKVETLYSEGIPEGKIIKIFPPVGNVVEKGREVLLSVAFNKPTTFLMPNLCGLNLVEAEMILKANGLFLGEIREINSDEKKGIVLIQYPEEGMAIKAGDTVRLILSKGR